jgi:tetratricopeptide (TPR) repeat protein
MKRIFAAITLGLLTEAYQAQGLQQPKPGIPDPRQLDTPRSKDTLDQDAMACSGKDPACGSNILVRPPRGGVSARTLAHKPSKAAVEAFNRGVRAWNKSEIDQALYLFNEAVRLDPGYAQARVNLGAVYAKTGLPEQALDQYEQALILEPNVPVLHSNKAAALVMLSRWEEAEQAARRALQLDPESIDGHYMLGIALMKQGKITPETATHLAIAAKKHLRARAFLAKVQADLATEPIGVAQKSPPTLPADPFIPAIEKMKYAVAPIDCLAVNGAESKILERMGTAFLVSESGDFLTAAHVIREMQKDERACPITAITFPADEWRPEARTEQMRWFPFKGSECRIDDIIDVAKCKLSEDLSVGKSEFHLKIAPVQFEWNLPRDGAQVAFTGFPLRARDPMTFRAGVAGYWMPLTADPIPELVLDHAALPGFSGSPVYLADGRVVAILVGNGKGEATGITVGRPASLLRELLTERPPK